MKTLLHLCLFLFGFVVLSAAPDPQANPKATPSMTIEEIAAQKSLAQVEQLAKSRKIPYNIQTTETMKTQADRAYPQAVAFRADGRLWLTFFVNKDADMVTVHVSFYYDRQNGYILGRTIILEDNNVP